MRRTNESMKKLMSNQSAGRALLLALKRQKIAKKREKISSRVIATIANPTRQRIFQYLTAHPCASPSQLARVLNHSIPTVRWHLRKLESSGYISSAKYRLYTLYFPRGIIVHDDECAIFHVLNKPKTRLIFNTIKNSPGSTQKELVRQTGIGVHSVIELTNMLRKHNIITVMHDGRYRRYYPTELLSVLRKRFLERVKRFQTWFLNRLFDERLDPRPIRKTSTMLIVEINTGTGRSTITAHTDPVTTLLSHDFIF